MPTPLPMSSSAPAPAGQSALPGQPPIGSSPATQPVPNRGLEAAGLAKLGIVVKQLEEILPLVGAGSEAGRDIVSSLGRLAKHVPSGAISSGIEQSALSDMLNKARQMAPQIAAMRNASMLGGAPGGIPQGAVPPPALQALMQQKAA